VPVVAEGLEEVARLLQLTEGLVEPPELVQRQAQVVVRAGAKAGMPVRNGKS